MFEQPNPTHFSLDFDHTANRDPIMWGKIIDTFRMFGHHVSIVTGRSDAWHNPDIEAFSKQHMIDVYYTNCESKRKYMERLGIKIDVWIDDLPEAVVTNWDHVKKEVTQCYVCNDNGPCPSL